MKKIDEDRVSAIAMSATLAGLTKETTKTMIKILARESAFVEDNLAEILLTIDNIFLVLNRK